MPTTLGPRYTIDWRGRPPHMLKEDIPIWYQFLEKWGFLFDSLYYDCLLGGITLDQVEEQDRMKRMWRANTAKRADAIAELPEELWIIEVAQRPSLRSIGQLITYQVLWIEDLKIQKPEILVLVAQQFDKDLFAAATRYGIRIYTIPPPKGRSPQIDPMPLY